MRVLIAEDDLTSRHLLVRMLEKWGHEPVVTCDGAEAWEALQGSDAPSLAILDWMMPGLDGPEICRRVRALEKADPTYIILLTARGGKDDIVMGLEAGANDYVGKPFDKDELRARVDVGRRFAELNESLLETQRMLAEQARSDALTGAMNRRAILARLAEEVAQARREESELGVGMIDIDHFKRVNDTWGHAAGDVVLCEVAGRCRRTMRPYDAFGRFGGEEFVAIVPNAGEAEVRGVLERVRTAVADAPVATEGVEIPVTVSIGGVVGRPSAPGAQERRGEAPDTASGGAVDRCVDALVRTADDALYQAKDGGRDRVVMAPTET